MEEGSSFGVGPLPCVPAVNTRDALPRRMACRVGSSRRGSAAAAAWGHRARGRDVDFVVVGFGLGALGVLLGVVMLGWLAPRSQRAATRVSAPDDAARHRALAAERHGTGRAFLYAGGAMLLTTVAGLSGLP